MNETKHPWAGFKYVPVPGLINRLLARHLRTQRKNMIRAFIERGYYLYAQRLIELRDRSDLNTVQKHKEFKKVLDAYAAELTGKTTLPATEAPHTPAGADAVDVQGEAGATGGGVGSSDGVQHSGAGTDAAARVHALAPGDGGA